MATERTTQRQDNHCPECCGYCRTKYRSARWHAMVRNPGDNPFVAQRDTWAQAMEAARGWVVQGGRAFVHRRREYR